MGERKPSKVNIPMCIACVLLCLTLFSIHLTAGLYARYTASSESTDTARVAKFSIGRSLSEDVTVECDTGDETGEYTVTVNNQSEVAVTYEIAVLFTEELDERLTLTLDKTPEDETDEHIEGTLSDDKKAMAFGTIGSLTPGASDTHKLVFAVKDWSYATENATGTTGERQLAFTVSITAAQID